MNKKEWKSFQQDQQEFRVLDYFPFGEYNFTLDITSKQKVPVTYIDNGTEKNRTYVKYNLINNDKYDYVKFTGMMYRLFMEQCEKVVTIKSKYIDVKLEVMPMISKISNITITLDGFRQHPILNQEKKHYKFEISNVNVMGGKK